MDSTFTPSHRGGSGPPLVCLHGFTDTWRTWELVLPALERHFDVFAPTLPGHAGGPPVSGTITDATVPDGIERAMDEAGIGTAHLVGNSLGGFVALQLAARGRAESVVALAPAGGWESGSEMATGLSEHFKAMLAQLQVAAPQAEAIVATPQGRRLATSFITTNYEHIPAELIAHLIRGVAGCEAALPLIDHGSRAGWNLDAEKITCPVRIAWGTEDRILPLPFAAARFRNDWLPTADWVELDGIGHCPQLDIPLPTAELIAGFSSQP